VNRFWLGTMGGFVEPAPPKCTEYPPAAKWDSIICRSSDGSQTRPKAWANITGLIRSAGGWALDQTADPYDLSSYTLRDMCMLMPGNKARNPTGSAFINVGIIYSDSVHFPVRLPYRFANRRNCNASDLYTVITA